MLHFPFFFVNFFSSPYCVHFTVLLSYSCELFAISPGCVLLRHIERCELWIPREKKTAFYLLLDAIDYGTVTNVEMQLDYMFYAVALAIRTRNKNNNNNRKNNERRGKKYHASSFTRRALVMQK